MHRIDQQNDLFNLISLKRERGNWYPNMNFYLHDAKSVLLSMRNIQKISFQISFVYLIINKSTTQLGHQLKCLCTSIIKENNKISRKLYRNIIMHYSKNIKRQRCNAIFYLKNL